MPWADIITNLVLILGGAIGGALLMWSWIAWPTARERAAAKRRHPSSRRADK